MAEKCAKPLGKTSPILVIEDDPATRDAIKMLLQYDGYTVATARHGGDALRKLRAGLTPCLILLDLVLPEVDGIQFRREQLHDATLAHIPVVIYSGYADARHQAAELGASGYFQKPFDLDAFLKIVETHCHRYASSAPNAVARPQSQREHTHSATRGKGPARGTRHSSSTTGG
jgi:CheY-like chemotaxis protein